MSLKRIIRMESNYTNQKNIRVIRIFNSLDLSLFTQFEIKVLKIVSTIPVGQTRSYKWVAQKAGMPRAVRAVGQVLKKNPFPLLIPCHRVIKNDGSIGGYSLGRKVKKSLLDLEKFIIYSK